MKAALFANRRTQRALRAWKRNPSHATFAKFSHYMQDARRRSA